MQKKSLFIILMVIGIIVLARLFNISDYFSLSSLQYHAQSLKAFIHKHYMLSLISFISVYIGAVALAIPAATTLTIVAGFLFDITVGTLSVNIAATTGACLSFLLTRYVAGTQLQQTYAVQFKQFNEHLAANQIWYLLSLRIIPVFPFFLINVLAGLTKVPLKIFIWTTSVGIIPGSLAYTFAGKQLTTIHTTQDIFSRGMLTALLALGALSLLPVVIKLIRSQYHQRHKLSQR